MEFSNLRASLANSGIRNKFPALYQTIDGIITTGDQVIQEINKKLDSSTIINLATQVKGLLAPKNGGTFVGIYIPELTNTANIDASAPFYTTWWRTGDIVVVSGKVTIDATAANTLTQLELRLPVKSFFQHEEQCSGVANGSPFSGSTVNIAGIVKANPANGNAIIEYFAPSTVDNDVRFFFSYQVLQQP